MRLVIILLLAGGLVYCLFMTGIIGTINSATSVITGLDSDDLSTKPLTPYALERSNCRASFPGKPHIGNIAQQLFTGGIHSGQTRIMADKKRVYYLCEFSVPAMDIGLPSSIPNKITISTFDPNNPGSSLLSNSNQMGNNQIAANANFDSDALKIQNALDKFTKDWLADHGARAEATMPIAIKGGLYSGRELKGLTRDGKRKFDLKFFCNYQRKTIVVIGIIAESSPADSTTGNTNDFLNSLDMW